MSGSSHEMAEITPRDSQKSSALSRSFRRARSFLMGKVCAFDAQLISHIYLLDGSLEEPATPPVYMVFDCLYQRGRTTRPGAVVSAPGARRHRRRRPPPLRCAPPSRPQGRGVGRGQAGGYERLVAK